MAGKIDSKKGHPMAFYETIVLTPMKTLDRQLKYNNSTTLRRKKLRHMSTQLNWHNSVFRRLVASY